MKRLCNTHSDNPLQHELAGELSQKLPSLHRRFFGSRHPISTPTQYYSVKFELRDKVREDEPACDRQGEKLTPMPRKKYIQ